MERALKFLLEGQVLPEERTIQTKEDLKAKREELYNNGWRRQRSYGDDCYKLALDQARRLRSGEYEAQVLVIPQSLTHGKIDGYTANGDNYEVWYKPQKIYKPWKSSPLENRKEYDYNYGGGHGY
jgi:hypothetical protein